MCNLPYCLNQMNKKIWTVFQSHLFCKFGASPEWKAELPQVTNTNAKAVDMASHGKII